MDDKPRKQTRPQPETPEPRLIRVSDCSQRPIHWLWHERLPLGKVSLLVGEPDAGKSFLCLDLAARVSRGLDIPPDAMLRKPAGVLLLCADDSLEDTIQPRLKAAGADLTRIGVL